MGTLNTCEKLKLFHYWHFHYNALLLPWKISLCSYDSHFLPKNCQWCSKVVFKIVAKVSDEFEKNFLAQEMMDALRLVYLQYWFKSSCEETFSIHMVLLKMFYCQPEKLRSNQTWILTIIDVDILNLQFFSSRSQWSLMHSGLWICLWIWILCPSFGENKNSMHYYVFILVSSWRGQSWQWFKSWALWKMKRFFQHWYLWKNWNWLCERLNLVIHLYAQPFNTITNFFIKMPSQHVVRKNTKWFFGLKLWIIGSVIVL